MNKKILISLSVVVAVAAIVIGGTIAYFSDTEVSQGNIFTAGTIDLKIDHTKQTYLGVDCKTCDVTIQSDTTNMVIAKDDQPIEPYNAVEPNDPGPNWAPAFNDAVWIWGVEDKPAAGDQTEYTFKNTFEWWGPINGAALELAISGDDDYWVYLNGSYVASETAAWQPPNDYYDHFADLINQGENEITFVVKNSGGHRAGLLYELTIDGDCQDDYFKNNCRLWGLKDLEPGDTFFNFNDIKPGDHGINVISYHVYNNDAHVCMIIDEKESEKPILSEALQFFMWNDENCDGVYDDGEGKLFGPGSLTESELRVSLGEAIGSYDYCVGLAWCAGELTEEGCNGAVMGNDYQASTMMADLIFYAEQSRHNPDFECDDVEWNGVDPS